jgi:hypothetical protein
MTDDAARHISREGLAALEAERSRADRRAGTLTTAGLSG